YAVGATGIFADYVPERKETRYIQNDFTILVSEPSMQGVVLVCELFFGIFVKSAQETFCNLNRGMLAVYEDSIPNLGVDFRRKYGIACCTIRGIDVGAITGKVGADLFKGRDVVF